MHSAPSSLYIHIPFCRSKCSYCDFFSVPEQGAISDNYVHALCRNIVYRCRQFGVTALETVYIGGGTPSLLSRNQLNRIMETVQSTSMLSPDTEITMEANPADITSELLCSLNEAGITRLSAGIQSVDEAVLKALGRRADAERVEQSLQLLTEEWVSHGKRLSLDLISGLPGLSDEQFERGVKRVMASGADHISLYALMLEEGTRLEKQVSEGTVVYSDETNDRQWIKGRDMLVEAGYAQYEVSNFARPGYESRHNSAYWHMNDYLGTGAGGTGTVGKYRWTETTDISAYMKFWNSFGSLDGVGDCIINVKDEIDSRMDGTCVERTEGYQSHPFNLKGLCNPPAEVELLDDDTREFEFLMMGFRLLEGVSAREYMNRFGKELGERIGAGDGGLFKDWQNRGLARTYCTTDGDTRYALTAEGILLLNQFLEPLL